MNGKLKLCSETVFYFDTMDYIYCFPAHINIQLTSGLAIVRWVVYSMFQWLTK